ncbi:MAG: carboxylating nicotinate-nucleotide diphosphorylase [Gemmatimonadota bacterium]|nr:carboxylating nicotinate-nucleotide diphosphorylase [Gemmatimonadota bacterium]
MNGSEPLQGAFDAFLRASLHEDLGDAGDVTSSATIPEDATATAYMVARESGCVAGLDVALRTFQLLDDRVDIDALVRDGASVEGGSRLARVTGPARAILSAERVALNMLGQLSGVATATSRLVDRVSGTGARIVDTRKTVPGIRALQKAAVRAGGGKNHRMGLYDAVLIKDNHIAAVGSPAEAVRRARDHVGPDFRVEVEIESLDDLEPVIESGADIVMLDNMEPERMRDAVRRAGGRCVLEASGGITLETVGAVAATGVDWISVGWLTHSAPSLDVALDFDDPLPRTSHGAARES